MKVHFLLLVLSTFLISSCVENDMIVNGLSPIYRSFDDFSGIQSEAPQAFENLGKIINVGDYLFINEIAEGIHVIDNTNPSNAVTILFWNIPGNTEFTIEGETLFADNGRHLLVIDISDFTNIQFVKHIPDVYIDDDSRVLRPPADYIGFFECPNTEDGFVVNWEDKELTNPSCEAY